MACDWRTLRLEVKKARKEKKRPKLANQQETNVLKERSDYEEELCR